MLFYRSSVSSLPYDYSVINILSTLPRSKILRIPCSFQQTHQSLARLLSDTITFLLVY
uniref:Uncharacterized protein n=1 Tax=Siphoviridae sp. ctr2f5 TaxID=2825684 RepID=A0A8S5QDI6_9CAUD|nr:MAG TPA: hypothetical protein [Siphoviridae sp. ctr2f5]